MRTTKPGDQTKHLANSREMFLRLLDVVRNVDANKVEEYRSERDYEALELYILGKSYPPRSSTQMVLNARRRSTEPKTLS